MERIKAYGDHSNVLTYVLEDDQDDLLRIQRILDVNGFSNRKMFDRGSSLIGDLNIQVDLMIADFVIPSEELNGLDVMKIVRAHYPHCHMIMVSGQSNCKNVIKFTNLGGFTRYVDKNEPGYQDQLVTFMQEAIIDIKKQIDLFTMFSTRMAQIEKNRDNDRGSSKAAH